MLSKYRFILGVLGGNPLHYAFFAISVLAVAVLEVASIGTIPVFTAILAQPVRMRGYLLEYMPNLASLIDSQRIFIGVSCIAIVIVFAGKNILLAFIGWAQARFIANRQADLATRLFSEFMVRPYYFHLQRDSAVLQRIVTTDAFSLFSGTFVQASQLLTEVLVVIFAAAMLIYVNPESALAGVAILGGFVLAFYSLFRSRIGDIGRRQQKSGAELIKWITQGLGGIKEVKLLGRESFFVAAFGGHIRSYARYGAYSGLISLLPRYIIETVVVICMSVAIILMTIRGVPPAEILSGLALFGVASMRLIPSVNRILAALTTMRFHRPAANVVLETFADLSTQQLANEPTQPLVATLSDKFSSLTVEDVGYSYPKSDSPALQNLTFTILQGDMVGIVGASGAGKSTLVDIMLGLHRPTTGTVRIDGVNVFSMLPVWQRMIGYVPQSIFLINDSIRRNIAFGLPNDEIDNEQVWRALRQAQLEEFVRALPEGFDTPVGESGSRLSGGQLQRVGIARALYRDPEVLVMDEATSALDNQTENEVGAVISQLCGAKSVMVVAHRLNTIKRCSKLIYLDGGRLEGEGTFDELRETNQGFRILLGELS